MEHAVCIPLSDNEESFGHQESTLFSLDGSRENVNQYWRDSTYLYVDVADPSSFHCFGCGWIETAILTRFPLFCHA